MIPLVPKHRKWVLVCTNMKEPGKPCCGIQGSAELHAKLKEAMKAVDPTIRVSKTGCLDRCSEGPTVAIMPDNVWFGGVTEVDISVIIEAATK